MSSMFGKSDEKITGGLNMKYQTVKREVKTFAVNGVLDKVRNSFSLDVSANTLRI